MSDLGSILIVDDDANLCKSLSLILKHKGYDVCTATDGVQAIETVRQKAFDFILMDVKMPLMDGVETNRAIKDLQPDAAVIMTTAFSLEEKIVEALQQGARHVMYKPVDADNLDMLLQRIKLRKAQSKKESPP